MRSLNTKLLIAFFVTAVIGVIMVALLNQWMTVRAFDRFLVDASRDTFVTLAERYYGSNGTWEGVGQFMQGFEHRGARQQQGVNAIIPNRGPRGGPRQGQTPQPTTLFALTDETGTVVMGGGGIREGDVLAPSRLEFASPVRVGSDTVGYVVTGDVQPLLNPIETQYVNQTNRAAMISAAGAALFGVILSAVLARTLTRPIAEMTAATKAMAGGDLEQRVPVRTEDELGQLARSFNQMSEDLARANLLRRQMTADIAHDLRTPLTTLNGYIEAMQEGVLEPTPTRFDAMYHEVQNLVRLVEDLRTLSLADAGELPLRKEATPPEKLLRRAASSFAHQAEQQGVTLDVFTFGDLPPLQVDPYRMSQVLGNLISNALRYTAPGGRVTLGARREGRTTTLTVKDTGTGIPPEKLEHIFDRFYRADVSRHQTTGESGLGLAIARSIVESHGGQIRVESTVGEGTTFTIIL